MIGRCASVSHIGLGACRVQLTGATMGQAVGTAASLCKKYRTDPRTVGKEHISQLQQLLIKDDQYIPNVKDNDLNNIAGETLITADSETENGKATNIINGKTRPRDGEDYAWVSSQKLPQSIVLKFQKQTPINEIRITFDIPFEKYKYGYMPQPKPNETVSDFTVEAVTENGSEILADIKGNYKRLVCIDAKNIKVSEIKITVNKCLDSDFAKITEVRVYR